MTAKKYVAGPYVDLKKEDVRDKKGRRIDEAYVERVIESADAVRSPGRPTLSGKPGPSPQIAVRLPVETYDRAVELAESRGVTLASLAREAVETYVKKAG